MARKGAALTESKTKTNSKAFPKSKMPKAKTTKKVTRGEGGKKKKGLSYSILTLA
jgi:hypothetical protein